MRVAILSVGAVMVRENGTSWLFGAPKNIFGHLKEEGIDPPSCVFSTQLRAPGLGSMGAGILRFKEEPLRMNDLQAKPIAQKHGTDYEITSEGARIFFSERGDVSVKDVEGYDLAIVRNKHRPDEFGDNVITWPWPAATYLIDANKAHPVLTEATVRVKVWSAIEDVPDNLKKMDGTSLTLEQANQVAKVAAASGEGEGKENWAIAISQFKKGHTKKDGSWVKREKEDSQSGHWTTVYKTEDGEWRWASITSAAILDRQGEYLSPKAMKFAIKMAEVIGRGPLRFRHIPGLDGGDCDTQLNVGEFLFEGGNFRDTPVGLAMRRKMQRDPSWQMSAGLLFAAKDLLHGTFFKRAIIFERSMTKAPAVPTTAVLTSGGMMTLNPLTEEQLKEAAAELELPLAEVEALHKQAIENGATPFSFKEFTEAALKAMKKGADAEEDEEEEGEEEESPEERFEKRKKALKDALADMTEAERKEVRFALDEVDESPAVLNEVRVLVKENTKAIQAILQHLEGQETTTDALAKMLAGTPKKQAAQFVSRMKGDDEEQGGVDDDSVAATLKEVREMLAAQKAGPEQFYNMFTSTELNRPPGGAQ